MAASSVTSLFSLCTLSPPISPSKFPPSGFFLPLSAKNPLSPLNIVPSSQIMPVVCQSLAYNVQVIVDDNEPEEKLLGRFRREVMRAGVIQECKRRRFFENKQDERKRKHREAAKRNRRRRPQFRTGPQDRQVVSKSSKREDDEDNWDLPSGDDIPYLS